MEIPGLTTFSGQPTITNPLAPDYLIVGQKSRAQKNSEATKTELSKQQAPTSLASDNVVNQANDADDTGLNAYKPGSLFDEKA